MRASGDAIAKIGGPILLQHGRGHLPMSPIGTEIELALLLQELCGATGYTIEGNTLLALRWDRDGNAHLIERYEVVPA